MKRELRIMFDGGCIPNPGRKYGSWMIEVNGQECTRRERIDFGQGTNNEAEFEALESALRFSLDNLPLAGLNPRDFSVFLETDSTIVRNRIAQKGGRVPKEGHKHYEAARRMSDYAIRCLKLLLKFRSFRIQWLRRDHNVAVFGH